MRLRDASVADAPGIAALHAASWLLDPNGAEPYECRKSCYDFGNPYIITAGKQLGRIDVGRVYDMLKRAEKAAGDRRHVSKDPTARSLDQMLASGFLKPQADYEPVSRKSIDPVRTLNVFLCHSSKDKLAVRPLYGWLQNSRVHPWLDEEELLPGHDWEFEISKAVRNSDVVIVCLSKDAVSKRGFVQKEIKFALDIADQQPEGAIFLIPLKLEDCEVPERLRRWHWVNLYDERGYDLLIRSLQSRAQALKVAVPSSLR